MRTRLTIMAIVLAAATGAIALLALLVVALGWLGLAMGTVGTAAVLGVYRLWVQPWQHRWGATDEEVHRAMPDDDLIPGAASTTRDCHRRSTRAGLAVAGPDRLRPGRLVQLRRIDNDGRQPHPPRAASAAGGRPDPDASGDGPAGP
jgi:hypothetical protein